MNCGKIGDLKYGCSGMIYLWDFLMIFFAMWYGDDTIQLPAMVGAW